MTYYTLILDANGNGTGSHRYAAEPDALPSNEVACTGAQAEDPTAWMDDGTGNLVAGVGPVPQSISFSQLLTALVAQGFITETEGEAWMQGSALPAEILGVISALPVADQFAAKAKLYRMSEADRASPLVAAIASTQSLTEAEIDQFFQFAATF